MCLRDSCMPCTVRGGIDIGVALTKLYRSTSCSTWQSDHGNMVHVIWTRGTGATGAMVNGLGRNHYKTK